MYKSRMIFFAFVMDLSNFEIKILIIWIYLV